LKESGCIKLVFGLETASKRLQKYIRKEIDLEHVKKIIRHCYNIGIWVDITFLCGLPYERYIDIYQTLIFIRDNYRYIRGINLNKFILKPNSEIYNKPADFGIRIKEKNTFDEINGLKWDEKNKYAKEVYHDIIHSVDHVKVDFTRPVHYVFRVMSNNTNINKINDYLEKNIFKDDMNKLEILIQKYRKIIKNQIR
jgi:radical SAM superfamily enzyme YgiQ (UPF0313 family)